MTIARREGIAWARLADVDPELWAAIRGETDRQRWKIEMIASENYTFAAVMEAQGSPLTNKYAEGLPGKRYYGGCEFVDVAERLAQDRALALFPGAEHVNVQPHSGAQANMAAYLSVLNIGDRIEFGMRIIVRHVRQQRDEGPRQRHRRQQMHERGVKEILRALRDEDDRPQAGRGGEVDVSHAASAQLAQHQITLHQRLALLEFARGAPRTVGRSCVPSEAVAKAG